ncbi:MAG: OB-fold nucleic acid binding domain-containing protein, partial [Ilumatobacteraceae bacterium]
KHGREEVENPHPLVAEMLSETYGIMVYQEQVMQTAQILGGYTLGGADLLRRAMGKKKAEEMALHRETFRAGAAKNGIAEQKADEIFDLMEKFAGYGFNKSHAAAYSLLAYHTGWLKVHFTAEFFCANMTVEMDNTDKLKVLFEDAIKNFGLTFEPPDVNRGFHRFEPVSDKVIRYGLGAVKGTGQLAVESIVRARQEGGPFKSLYDFCCRVDRTRINKRTVEALVKAGAFDSLGHPRKGLLGVFEHIIDTTLTRRRERERGVMSLFGDWNDGPATEAAFDERVPVPAFEFDKSDKLRNEKEMLGLYVSDHPLFGAEAALRRKVEHSIADLVDLGDGTPVNVGGVVTGVTRKFTRKGDQMAVFVLEDLDANIEVTLFPRTLVEHGHKLTDDIVVAVKGRLDRRDEARVNLICHSVEVLQGLDSGPAPPLTLRIPATALDELTIQRLKRILRDHPGDSPVVLDIGSQVLRLSDEFRVDIDHAVGELRMAFGHDAVVL